MKPLSACPGMLTAFILEFWGNSNGHAVIEFAGDFLSDFCALSKEKVCQNNCDRCSVPRYVGRMSYADFGSRGP